MVTVRFSVDTPVAPEQVVGALIDFSPRRTELWPSLDPKYFTVHGQGDTWADVTEGSSAGGGIWERSHYEWSEPGVVRLTVTDSNMFKPGSYWEYRVTPSGTGSHVEFVMSRTPGTLKGRLVALVLRLNGSRSLGADFLRAMGKLQPEA